MSMEFVNGGALDLHCKEVRYGHVMSYRVVLLPRSLGQIGIAEDE